MAISTIRVVLFLSTPIPSISLTKAIKKSAAVAALSCLFSARLWGQVSIYSTGMLVILPSSRLGVSKEGKMEENALSGEFSGSSN